MVSLAQAAAFSAFVLPVSMLPAWYVMSRLVVFFGLSLGLYFWLVVVLLGLLFLASMGMPAISDNPSLRGVNVALGLWAGFFLILIFCLMFFDISSIFFTYPDYRTEGKAVLLLTLFLTIAGAVNLQFLRVRRVRLPQKELKEPMRIVQISDLHLGPIHSLAYFKDVVRRTNAERPDLVVITGDFIDGRLTDEMFAPLNDIKAPVYFCVGNHEHYAGIKEFTEYLGRTKAVMLMNKKVDLEDIELAGIDFDWSAKAFDPMIAKVKPSGKKYAVLISHGPPAFDPARKAGFELTLSGHTHGGQFWPFTMFGRAFVKYRAGLYERDGKHLFVTTGTGTWGPPIRLGSNSEIAVIDIGKRP